MTREQIAAFIEERGLDEYEILLADGFDDAFMGLVERAGSSQPVACYDRDRCIEILMEQGIGDYTDAVEYFDFNVIGAYVGDGTPYFMTRMQAS
jgi:hypothetical protein